jgi:phosphoglycolate phosphatase-like HAD superfamily hydrolase
VGKTASPIAVVVFDLDGTLIESDAVKTRAYFDIFPPAAASAVEAAIKADRYENRFSRIARILRDFHGAEPAQAEIDRLAKAYNDICETHQATCAERPGASTVLARLASKRPLYMCSGTWEESLVRVVKARGWQQHFKGVYGGPRKKRSNLERVAAHAGVAETSMLVVGDTRDDRDAAVELGCSFRGVKSGSSDFGDNPVTMIAELSELERL